MSLVKTWASYFQASVRMRGRAYFRAGRVKQLPPKGGETVRAQVRGNRVYEVTIRGEGSSTTVQCTCPYFAGGTYCKHIWATLLDVHHHGIGPHNKSIMTPDPEGDATVDNGGEDEAVEAAAPSGAGGESAFDSAAPRPPKARKREPGQRTIRAAEPEWVGRLSLLRPPGFGVEGVTPPQAPTFRQVCYVVHAELSSRFHTLVVELRQRQPTRTGWTGLKRLKINAEVIGELTDPIDREVGALIMGGKWIDTADFGDQYGGELSHSVFRLPAGAWRALLDRMIQTGRCFLETDDEAATPLTWDAPTPTPGSSAPGSSSNGNGGVAADATVWMPWIIGTETIDGLLIELELRRGDERMQIDEPDLVLPGADGLAFYDGRVAAFDDRGAARWITQFRDDARSRAGLSPLTVAAADIPRFLDRLYALPNLPEIELPEGVGRREEKIAPRPHLEVTSPTPNSLGGNGFSGAGSGGGEASQKNQLAGRCWFAYGEHTVMPGRPGRFVVPPSEDKPAPQTNGKKAAKIAREDEDDADADDLDELNEGDSETAVEKDLETEATAEVSCGPALIRRDPRGEAEALALLNKLGFRPSPLGVGDRFLLHARQLPAAVSELVRRGWSVTADRRVVRAAAAPTLSIRSGIDWFELHGSVKFQTNAGEQSVGLPEILAAVRAGKSMVTLGDGSQGLLPEQWLKDHGLLVALGQVQGDHLVFKSTQAAMLDALLTKQELTDVDAKFDEARRRLSEFEGVKPIQPAATFHGELRPYQCEGLGWLAFLRHFGMGGILADDMGLGKTIQVLAMLDAWYGGNGDAEKESIPASPRPGVSASSSHLPTLIVVPRSVVFNWIDEAARFAPGLRVQTYTGADRQSLRESFAHHDVIVTTYGLMRRDIAELAKHRFQYVVLDEAQAVKNPGSQSAKATRLLQANHRLALTGTPVENHLGDLWSIFEFLNPGMLGSSGAFAELIRGTPAGAPTMADDQADEPATAAADGAAEAGEADPDPGALKVRLAPLPKTSAPETAQVARALRPFILRRTKRQVLTELPEKTEQTILCEMEPAQREVYDQLLRHYRGSLLQHVENQGVEKNTMMVLEALLRLRQAACHPALIDPKRQDAPSAKIDELLDRVSELIEEGHKALVFSQFTSFLALVRQRLDARGITYEYLDGQTRNRKQHVHRFQSDPDCPLFLISLKAGGLGLNLTAAEYVFILDPWWNPAVESQAIDRAHRIGQTRHVFAYRLICENTVEQRIIQLQDRKRKLADAIVGAQENVLRSLTREDLEQLLS